MAKIRLDKLLSAAAGLSRTEARDALKAGRVTVNGARLTDGSCKVEENSQLLLDGASVTYRANYYLMMNKPAGYISATEDPREKTVLLLLPPEYAKTDLFPAGRLDKDAEGLLLLTSDGDFCHRVISPKSCVWKRYFARTEGKLLPDHIEAFRSGIVLNDGLECLPAELEILSSGEESTCIVTVREGKFHQVKRMLASCGCPVVYLKRISIGGLHLDPHLAAGESRPLTDEELQLVFASDKVTKE